MQKLRLHFTVDRSSLVFWTITRCRKRKYVPGTDQKSIRIFQGAARRFDRIGYDLIRNNHSTPIKRRKWKYVQRFMRQVAEIPEFAALLTESIQACKTVRREWKRDYRDTSKMVRNILGFNVSGTITVLVLHPSLRVGRYDKNRIYWTNRTDWPHYNSVYLWHEVLHSIFGVSMKEHAVIELIADNELRVRLNGGKYPPWQGHQRLNRIRNQLLPRWKEYLRGHKRDIRKFLIPPG